MSHPAVQTDRRGPVRRALGALRPRRGTRQPHTAAGRIRRLRRRIALLFALTSAAGFIALAVFAVHNDGSTWRGQVDQSLNLRTSQAVIQLTYTGDEPDAADLVETMDTDCPPLHLLVLREDGLRALDTLRRPCVSARPADVREAATRAIDRAEVTARDSRARDGRPVRLVAEPYISPSSEEADSAVVAVADTSEQHRDHDRLTWGLTGACAALVLVSALIGRLLAGQAIRPALRALDQQEAFLADAAHDLRTPAASLSSLAETALRGETDPADVLRRSLRLARRMGALVDGLLTRARLMAGVGVVEHRPLRLDQLAETVVELVEPSAGDPAAGAHQVTVDAAPTVVEGDAELLRRAVANLLGNALAHGHAPGEPAEVRLTVTPDGTLTVDDAGPGLPPGLDSALFDRHRSTTGSTGLGLSIASWVAHAHGGTLTAGPSPTGGARFVLRIPARKGRGRKETGE
ncbi:sensor histidine kinase [Streptomyces sp. SCSIO ZS0520]|uniref:sensor histidine kinase n=1 Tax=Streptomyces sp. SCSIO ZS0520 TaxID=2892996 RepID=UPI0021DA64AC|nr:HAMP domain-containing sensor histidine kinase [Streptomyces sp. SCSIO ZS0520]